MTPSPTTPQGAEPREDGLPNRHVPDHPDAYLNALLDYTKGFYSATREAGLPAKVCADAMQHVESAARGLHRKAMAVVTPAPAAPTNGGGGTITFRSAEHLTDAVLGGLWDYPHKQTAPVEMVRSWAYAVADDQAALQPQPTQQGGAETWASMAAWTETTFGPVSLERIATRANEEMVELLADPSDVMEAADVIIVLSRYPGIEDAINRKMAINRQREWRLNGDGSGYHIKSDAQ